MTPFAHTQRSSNFFHNLMPNILHDQAYMLFPITFFIDQILGEKWVFIFTNFKMKFSISFDNEGRKPIIVVALVAVILLPIEITKVFSYHIIVAGLLKCIVYSSSYL